MEYCCLVLLRSDKQWLQFIISISQVHENLIKKTPDKTATNSHGIAELLL